jgi:hypothetical protein
VCDRYILRKVQFNSMPTLVAELSSLQRIWLYENQLPRGDSYEEKWNPPGNNNSSNFDASIFRSKQPPDRKRKILLPSDTTSRNVRANTNSNGPRFPYTQDKLTWRQSWENLKAYRDHYGVGADCVVLL